MLKILCSLFFIFTLAQCAEKSTQDAVKEIALKGSPTMSLAAAVANPKRSASDRARDIYRHPLKTLRFFDVQPEMTVVEVSPGSGWYTDIIAPALKGKLYLAIFDDNDEREYFRNINKVLKKKISENKTQYGNIEYTVLAVPQKIGPIAPANSADRVLTFRNVHNWMKAGKAQEVFKEFYRVLKKGGVLGVVEHRANPKTKKDPKAVSGYVHTEQVLELAKAAGFKLLESSEINANTKDSTVHPKGVWTLPPRYRLGDKDKAKYTKIGESDRMTLKFVK